VSLNFGFSGFKVGFYCLGFFEYGLIFRVLEFWNITWFVFVHNIGIKNQFL